MRRLVGEQKRNYGPDQITFCLNIARVQPLQGETRYLPRILQIKFVFDVRTVGFYRFGIQMQKASRSDALRFLCQSVPKFQIRDR